MYESNKKMSGHQNLSKTSTWQAETWLFLSSRQKKEGRASENLPETENRVMNRSHSELPLGLLRSFDFLLSILMKKEINFYFILLFYLEV